MTIYLAIWGLPIGIVLLVLDKYIKNYSFDVKNIFTYIRIAIRLVWGVLIFSTLSVFYSVAFHPENMANCYNDCSEYYIYILIGSLIALLVEIVPLVLHYLNVNIREQIRGFGEEA